MLLAAIPLWLHLSRRRKFRRLETGTLRFLEEATRSRRHKARWEEILLMLLRIGATILLALLFARPVFSGKNESEDRGGMVLVLIDASGSVTEKMTKSARAAASKALRKSGAKSDSVTIAQFSDRVESLESIADYRPRPGSPTRLDRGLDWALDRFLESGNPHSGRLILIGHFAGSALPETPPRVWPAGIGVTMIPLSPKTEINAAVTHVELRTPYKTEQMEIEARLLLPPEKPTRVAINVEGLIDEKELRPGTERVLFQFRPTRETVRGWVEVKTDPDAWPLDDRRPFVFQWTEQNRILLVDGDPGGTPFEGEAYFLKKALEASGAEHGMSSFAPEISYGLQNRLGMTDLSDFDVVALCGVGEISPAEAQHLKDFVAGGGGLFVILGTGWGPSLYAALVDAELFPKGFGEETGETERRILKWENSHPALASFGSAEGGDLRALSWRDGYEFATRGSDEDWKTLAELEGGRPILLGKERVLVCPHPLNRDWTDLPREPIFVPLVKELFSFLASAKEPPRPSEILVAGVDENREPGWYVVPDQPAQVVVTDPAESSVGSVSLRETALALGLPPGAAGEREDDKKNELARATKASEIFEPGPRELWPWIALLLLGWFTGEGIIATGRVRG